MWLCWRFISIFKIRIFLNFYSHMIEPTRIIAFHLNFWRSPFYVMTASCFCQLMWNIYRVARLSIVRWIRRICLILSLIYEWENLTLTSIIFKLSFFLFTSRILMIAFYSNHYWVFVTIFVSHLKGRLVLLSLLFNIWLDGSISFRCFISASQWGDIYLMAEYNLVVCKPTISSVWKAFICVLRILLQIIS